MEKITFPEKVYGGYIFDCDGTLANSMPIHLRAWRHALDSHGAKFEFDAKIFQELAGVGHADTVLMLNKRFNDTLSPERVVPVKEQFFADRIREVEAIEEVAAFARMLHAEGRKVSVASGSPRTVVHGILKTLHLDELFDVVVTQDDVTRSKPHPDIFLKAASLMGVDPTDCLVLEDGQLGIEGAKAAGMDWLLIPSRIEV